MWVVGTGSGSACATRCVLQLSLVCAPASHAAAPARRYEEYLDSQITETDLYYLEDEELARDLVELGYRGSGEILRREEFEAKKLAAEETRKAKLNPKPKKFASADKDLEGYPLLQALAQREELVRNGKLTT